MEAEAEAEGEGEGEEGDRGEGVIKHRKIVGASPRTRPFVIILRERNQVAVVSLCVGSHGVPHGRLPVEDARKEADEKGPEPLRRGVVVPDH